MFTRTIEKSSPKRQRVNESQSAHSLALRACMEDKHGAVQLIMKLRGWLASSIAVGSTMFLVGLLFHTLGPLITLSLEQHYKNRDLFRDWNGWTSTYILMHPFLFAPVFSAVFLLLRKKSDVPLGASNGLVYGASVFCVGSLPVFLIVFASLRVPFEVIAAWTVQNLVQYLAAGFTVAGVARKTVARPSI